MDSCLATTATTRHSSNSESAGMKDSSGSTTSTSFPSSPATGRVRWTRAGTRTSSPTSRSCSEKEEVGGSIIHVRRDRSGAWKVVKGSEHSRRFYGDGPVVPYDGPVAGSGLVPDEGVLGTLANCSGAQTPWGTVLSCEENFQSYGLKRAMPFALGWIRDDGSTEEEVNYYIGEPGINVDNQPVTDRWPFYGYVVEIDPLTGEAVKHTALGRIHHENVGWRIAPSGRVIAYTGDDAPAADGMFFKFVSSGRYRKNMSRSDAMRLLSDGQLYVAQWFPSANDAAVDQGVGVWHPLDMNDPEAMAFTTRWIEANIVPQSGGDLTQFRVPRAEDCECVPGRPKDVLISLTSARGRPADPAAYGIVRLLVERNATAGSHEFEWVDLLEGGQDAGFASPDNLGFSGRGHLWVVTDISSSSLNTPGRGFEWHENNAIFYVPLRGRNANIAFRFANAPVHAELTGPTFVESQDTLFLNVQHSGEETPTGKESRATPPRTRRGGRKETAPRGQASPPSPFPPSSPSGSYSQHTRKRGSQGGAPSFVPSFAPLTGWLGSALVIEGPVTLRIRPAPYGSLPGCEKTCPVSRFSWSSGGGVGRKPQRQHRRRRWGVFGFVYAGPDGAGAGNPKPAPKGIWAARLGLAGPAGGKIEPLPNMFAVRPSRAREQSKRLPPHSRP
ncbi:MAG: DUF839 domain-containing protein [Actinobacteria bacterium]|nr:DUF839 domain-containing protein [Actinomycetota bacterium]